MAKKAKGLCVSRMYSFARADWPGRLAGVRAPEAGETPLSEAEVYHAAKMGLCHDPDEVDCWPVARLHRRAGTWSSYSPGLRAAGPFDGLLA